MTWFHVQETFRDGGVDVELYRAEPLPPDHAARLIERGMLKPHDEQVAQTKLGEFVIDYPEGGFPAKVRRRVHDWLAANAGMTDADSIEIQMFSDGLHDLLARLEAATVQAVDGQMRSGADSS